LIKQKSPKKLNISRQDNQPPLNVCIQVNISEEESKSGLSVQECSEVSTAVKALPRLNLRGLMTIPQHNATEIEQRKTFKAMSKLLLRVRDSSPQLTTLDTLSMGMSSDLEAALQEGATIIRVGSAIFGPR